MRDTLEALAEYARELEVQLEGPDAAEGEPLIAANHVLSGDRVADNDLGGTCPDNPNGGPHEASENLCTHCMEYI